MTGTTDEGRRAYELLDWANQDQAARVPEAVRLVDQLARELVARPDASGRALAEVRDVGGVLARLEDSLSVPLAEQDDGLELDLAWFDEYLDDAVPDEVTTRLGMISGQLGAEPLSIGGQLELAAIHGHHIKGTAYTYRHGWLPLVGQQLVDKYPAWKVAESKQRAAARASMATHSPVSPRTSSSEQARMAAAVRKSVARHEAKVQARQAKAPEEPHVPSAAPVSPPPAKPGSAGEELTREDPALASLAAPGASMAALKAYIDARVSAEVARQMNQISEQQHRELQDRLSVMHRAQQRLISSLRAHWDDDRSDENRKLQTKVSMNSLFTLAGVGVAVGGLAVGLTPVVAAISLGVVPLVNVIHDYVRSL